MAYPLFVDKAILLFKDRHLLKVMRRSISEDLNVICHLSFDKLPSVVKRPTMYASFSDQMISLSTGFILVFHLLLK
jgi:hypothetical protein